MQGILIFKFNISNKELKNCIFIINETSIGYKLLFVTVDESAILSEYSTLNAPQLSRVFQYNNKHFNDDRLLKSDSLLLFESLVSEIIHEFLF